MQIEDALLLARSPDRPVLIAGPTASGKSQLALAIAEAHGGRVINADALQVYARWRILTARPGVTELARAPHALYGHVADHAPYSVGAWLADLAPLIAGGERPVIVGGTGLYLTALTEGLAPIPATPPEIRAEADARLAREGSEKLLAEIDAATRGRIDTRNPARVQRAWEVLRTTGTGLAQWQDRPHPPLLPRRDALRFVVHAPPERLGPRIAARFDAMLRDGALDEVRSNLGDFQPKAPADRAIGAAELAAFLAGRMAFEAARDRAIITTRQYAKRQRTWFRARMTDWDPVESCG